MSVLKHLCLKDPKVRLQQNSDVLVNVSTTVDASVVSDDRQGVQLQGNGHRRCLFVRFLCLFVQLNFQEKEFNCFFVQIMKLNSIELIKDR